MRGEGRRGDRIGEKVGDLVDGASWRIRRDGLRISGHGADMGGEPWETQA